MKFIHTVTALLIGTLSTAALTPIADAATIPNTPPTTTLPFDRQSGNCPKTIQLWTSLRGYEGGAEHTAILNVRPIAGSAKIVDGGDQFVIFGAPLKPQYASCVGWVKSPQAPQYNIWLQFGHAYFRFDLRSIPGRPFSEITYQNIVNGQPFVRYAIAD